ncbi:MAG TPA: cbb3-type cytochrome c oxidase N-terminal domain-containing protein [Polyangiaceae bacterium]|jgi:cytochrome c oxidase cbb3-type subunit 3|nr:cbb3-type cytochrome c oxidase N-terminal domain-containing protein [Polyangiaceae bacterium]
MSKKTPDDGEHLLDHEYDGIREYDNPLPGWWVYIFWGSFVFSLGYWFHYHLSGNGVSVAAGHAAEVAEAHRLEAKRALAETVSEEGLQKLMLDASLMADAKNLFTQRCTPCHGEQGQGVIGPNLTDEAWIHGTGELLHIYKTVSEGVPAKGMPSWRMQLSAVQVRELAAFVGTLRGKNLPGKAPEGVVASSR